MERIESILERYNKAQGEKNRFRALYDNVYRFMMPDKYSDLSEVVDEATGKKTRIESFTSLMENVADGFVYNVQSMLAPVNMDWIDFEAGYMFGDGEENQAGKDEANRRLGNLAKLLNIYKRNSNFDIAFTSALYDLIPGQMTLLIIEGTTEAEPIVFIPVPFREITIIRNKSGMAEAFYRKKKYKNKEIKRIWADANFAYDATEAEKEISLTECTEFNYESGRWDYWIIDDDKKNIVVEREFKTSPFVEMPWTLTSGETYGRGQGLKTIADCMTLNRLKEYGLRSLQFLVKQGENIRNWIIRPGAMLTVEENHRDNPAMQQMGVTQQADLTQFNMEQLEMGIKKTMFNLDVPNSREVTATEYSDRKAELIKQVMNSYGRAVNMQTATVKRMIEVLQRGGRFPLEVDVEMFNGFGARIKMHTVLANGQKLESVRDKMSAIGLLNQFDPSGDTTKRFVKTDIVIPKLLMDIGLEAEDIRSTEELNQYDQMQAEAAARAHAAAIEEKVAVENAIADGKERAKAANARV